MPSQSLLCAEAGMMRGTFHLCSLVTAQAVNKEVIALSGTSMQVVGSARANNTRASPNMELWVYSTLSKSSVVNFTPILVKMSQISGLVYSRGAYQHFIA